MMVTPRGRPPEEMVDIAERERKMAVVLRAAVNLGLAQAERREFSHRTVGQIAEAVLSEAA